MNKIYYSHILKIQKSWKYYLDFFNFLIKTLEEYVEIFLESFKKIHDMFRSFKKWKTRKKILNNIW
jgi:hypothetical protein